jgi:hypothetical protein
MFPSETDLLKISLQNKEKHREKGLGVCSYQYRTGNGVLNSLAHHFNSTFSRNDSNRVGTVDSIVHNLQVS